MNFTFTSIKHHFFCQVKNEGYDGREASQDAVDEEPSQWNLPGSLLYSVTIITTIGRNFVFYVSKFSPFIFRLRSHRPQDHVGADRHYGVRRVRAADLHALAEQCRHAARPDIHIPLCEHLLLCLPAGKTEQRWVI